MNWDAQSSTNSFELEFMESEANRHTLGRIMAVLVGASTSSRSVLVAEQISRGSEHFAALVTGEASIGGIVSAGCSYHFVAHTGYADPLAIASPSDPIQRIACTLQAGDIVLFLAVSDGARDLSRLAECAQKKGAVTIGLLGRGAVELARKVDQAICTADCVGTTGHDVDLSYRRFLARYLRRLLACPPRPVAFLDRDGTINERAGLHEYVTSWEQFRFIPGAKSLLAGLANMGYALVMITNQQGIGKGIMTLKQLDAIHQQMGLELERDGIVFDGIFVCPHLASASCYCRKPKPGLIHRALDELPFVASLARSVLIGDSESDMQAGHFSGIGRLIQVSPSTDRYAVPQMHRVRCLADALSLIREGRPSDLSVSR